MDNYAKSPSEMLTCSTHDAKPIGHVRLLPDNIAITMSIRRAQAPYHATDLIVTSYKCDLCNLIRRALDRDNSACPLYQSENDLVLPNPSEE